MPILYQHRYTPADCLANPDVLYVFGDNLTHSGKLGQSIIRGLPNAVGLYTKRSTMDFLRDFDYEQVLIASEKRRHRLELQHRRKETIVWPLANIGTGSAELAERAPKIATYWNGFLNHLDSNYHVRSRRI